MTATRPDGTLKVANGQRGAVTLPADYTAVHVALGYALTVHKAQGVTVDRSLMLVDDTMSAEGLDVGMTRGRALNEAHIHCDSPDDQPVDNFRNTIGGCVSDCSGIAKNFWLN
ncbi:MAG TPA: hypothetical protein PL156_11940 [Rhodoglobus sp.]|nr:hypothetical protein [Rhodoglobus sp.]